LIKDVEAEELDEVGADAWWERNWQTEGRSGRRRRDS
jgi:hypothetical protein